MADSFSSHCSFPEGHQQSITAVNMLAEDSDTSMGLPPKKHAFGPLAPPSCESEQIDSRALESEDESSKYALCSTRPGSNL